MNHLKDLRESNGLRQADLAMEAGCSRAAVMRMEQLVYPEPLPNVLNALSDVSGISADHLRILYASDVEDHRYWSGQKWLLDMYTVNEIDNLVNGHRYGELFEYMRKEWARRVGEAQSQIHFCMAFSIHPAVLSKYESGATNHLPSGVLEALLGGGLGRSVTDYLRSSDAFNGGLALVGKHD